MDKDLYALEKQLRASGFQRIAGVDEVGRGACAGPLVAAAVILPEGMRIDGLGDSKTLTPAKREKLAAQIYEMSSAYTVVVIPASEVDLHGLHTSNIAALRRAALTLQPQPDYVLIDGFPADGFGVPCLAVRKGDATVACVAAASIVAKVTRDRLMEELDQEFPHYGFRKHKGYATAAHSESLSERGPCREHRRSYANVREALVGSSLS